MKSLDCAIPNLESELRELLAQVPAGRVTTYGDLADALGLRAAARWVGEYLREHEHAPGCPCHRVLRKDGELGLFHKHSPAAQKAQRLRREGVRVVDGVVERFPELRFRDFKSQRPLARLVELQAKLADRVRLDPYHGVPSLVAGLDVSYAGKGLAVGACAVVETASGRVAWSTTCRQAAALPYIPSLLTFREVPLLLSLFETARQAVPELDLFLVDGNGILHPRGAGVAACFGVLADVPTIGVAKSLLCGQVAADAASINGRPAIAVDGKVVGAVLARSERRDTRKARRARAVARPNGGSRWARFVLRAT